MKVIPQDGHFLIVIQRGDPLQCWLKIAKNPDEEGPPLIMQPEPVGYWDRETATIEVDMAFLQKIGGDVYKLGQRIGISGVALEEAYYRRMQVFETPSEVSN